MRSKSGHNKSGDQLTARELTEGGEAVVWNHDIGAEVFRGKSYAAAERAYDKLIRQATNRADDN